MNKYLEELEYFFNTDLKIKQIMLDCAPNEMDATDEKEYYKKIRIKLNSVYSLLSRFLTGPFFTEPNFLIKIPKIESDGIRISFQTIESNALQILKDKMQSLNSLLQDSEYNNSNLNEIYNQIFSHMNDELINNVRNKLYGFNSSHQYAFEHTLSEASSINEILHVLHTYVENNPDILASLPVVKSKEQPEMRKKTIGNNTFCKLVGHENNKLANQIFDELDILSSSYIVALDNKVMMMVRDYGHALTIQITELDNGTVKVDYYIPDLKDDYNVENLNVLMPEIQQTVHKSANNAVGGFAIDRNNAPSVICSFIDLIPKDEGLAPDLRSLMQFSSEDEAIKSVEKGDISPKLLLLHLRHTKITNPTDEFIETLRSTVKEKQKSCSSKDREQT